MTNVTRTVKRRTIATRVSRGRRKDVIVIIEPPGVEIGFRLHKERRTFKLPVSYLYGLAVEWEAKQRREAKKLARKERRQ